MSIEIFSITLAMIVGVNLLIQARVQRTITTLIAAIEALNANDKRLLDTMLKTNKRIQKLEPQNKMNKG